MPPSLFVESSGLMRRSLLLKDFRTKARFVAGYCAVSYIQSSLVKHSAARIRRSILRDCVIDQA
jgi:hypothetical protein